MERCGDCGQSARTNPDNDLCQSCERRIADMAILDRLTDSEKAALGSLNLFAWTPAHSPKLLDLGLAGKRAFWSEYKLTELGERVRQTLMKEPQ